MTIFPVIQLCPIHNLISKQSNKHILIVVKCLQLSTNNIKVLLKLGADVKDSTLLQDCGESNINYPRDLVMIERTGINIKLHRE